MKNYIMLFLLAAFVLWAVGQLDPNKPVYATVFHAVTNQTEEVVQVPAGTPNNNLEPYCEGHDDICDSLRRAGFTDIRLMMAIARAESGLRIDAIGDTTIQNSTWGPSVGVLQVRTIKPGHAQGCRVYEQLWNNLDAQTECAYQIFKSQGLKAWSAYTNGSYQRHLN